MLTVLSDWMEEGRKMDIDERGAELGLGLMAAGDCGRDSGRGTAKSGSGQGVGGGGQGKSAFGRLGVRGTTARQR